MSANEELLRVAARELAQILDRDGRTLTVPDRGEFQRCADGSAFVQAWIHVPAETEAEQ